MLMAVSMMAPSTQAGELNIEFTGLDVVYDGSDLFTSPSDDPIDVVTISHDGFVYPAITLADNPGISVDVFVPQVLNLDATGDTTMSGAGGYLDLTLAGSDSLEIDLNLVSVSWVDVQNIVRFVFAGSAGQVDSQQLPYGLVADDDVTIAFSARVRNSSLTTAGGEVTGFRAYGTGQVTGTATVIPEPVSAVLLLGALAAFASRRRS
ncbi:hypothetical protein Mal64_09410 [Pseudobythopirellula maris]|uniref:PEP-CTERM protein-sorting domain-containing protein n=2 Tax=Pseudobythopirellula maris TaxID=2527991 RepID=A0A5C5ZSR5_9BACT|nr:hypothetical protein Mal64_09410 [Pseudobythopirellula maris]